jgi:DNA modification methylase
MLSWVGKRSLRDVRAFPSQLVERFAPDVPGGMLAHDVDWTDWPDRFDRGGLLFHGDNKEVLAHLLAGGFRGKVDLVYIDPPFDSGADYVRKVQLRGASGSARLDGETYTLGEQIQYTDIWADDAYLQFMFERLLLISELMSAKSSIYLHCDWRRTGQLRPILDEVFGADNFLNEVIWHFPNKLQGNVNRFATNHNNLLVYAKSRSSYTFHRLEEERDKPIKVNRRYWDAAKGHFATLRDDQGKVLYAERSERIVDDVWVIAAVSSDEGKQLDYPTQKPEELIQRAVIASSNPGDIVLDCFIGSGTTAAVAQKLGRRWIGADINKGAIQTTEKRLAGIIRERISAGQTEQLTVDAEDDRRARPAQASFTVRRVNDYDLQIQHNEAVELAVEHLGVERTRADTFFHGTLGRELVYIVPFDHPSTLLDLQAVVHELEARPGDERNVVVVGLGRELSTAAWLENYNRHRPINKMRLIDLRTDERYGRFFEHRPASARVTFERANGWLRVRIDDFMSPSILERLAGANGILSPQITDWRSMVDSVAIDTAYDGEVFDVDLIDIPESKADVVAGTYELEFPPGDCGAAVRITDMLGEEILLIEGREAQSQTA